MSLSAVIPDYPDYTIYSDGRVYSRLSKKFLKPNANHGGYLSVELRRKGKKERRLIHRLVASAFIPNPANLPQVNHKDEHPSNNDVSNLEWCTAKYNMNYGFGAKTRHLKIDYTKPCYRENAIKNGRTVSRPVGMYTDAGVCVATFDSTVDASVQTGIHKTNITRSARSDHLKAGGYKWEYEKEE